MYFVGETTFTNTSSLFLIVDKSLEILPFAIVIFQTIQS